MKYILANEWLRNIFAWLLIMFAFYLAGPQTLTGKNSLILACFFTVLYVSIWLNNRVLFRIFLPQGQYWAYVAFLIPLLGVMMLFNHWAYSRVPIPENESWSWGKAMARSCLTLFGGFGIHAAYREIMHRQSALEQELLAKRNELRFLQNQVNPHFLFNALNNLYSASLTEPQQVSEHILQMAELLRYQLSCSKREFVPLEEEIDFLLNYMDVEKRRLGRQVILNLETSGDFAQKHIAPLLFLPFLENAFKYSTGGIEAADIQVRINTTTNSIRFFAQNSIPGDASSTPVSTGIGIENVRKRLELLYPGRYILSVKAEKSHFFVDLNIHSLS